MHVFRSVIMSPHRTLRGINIEGTRKVSSAIVFLCYMDVVPHYRGISAGHICEQVEEAGRAGLR